MGVILDLLNDQYYKFSEELLEEAAALEIMATLMDWNVFVSAYSKNGVSCVNFHKNSKTYSFKISNGHATLVGESLGLANIIQNMTIADFKLELAVKDCIKRINKLL